MSLRDIRSRIRRLEQQRAGYAVEAPAVSFDDLLARCFDGNDSQLPAD